MNVDFRVYRSADKKQTLELILSIQQREFGVPISANDQPDLQNIPGFYQSGNGNFWVAIHDKQVVGTIALLDIANDQVALRKMFVAEAFRGAEKGVANALLQHAHSWAKLQGVSDIYLGTIDVYRAAMRFYEKNGYEQINKPSLPESFPLIAVDNVFYHKRF
jgi:GNAT superfamily N-acetyltransferase